ncbi:MAG: asparagine synthase (glutamine-hydrolyzing) [Pseudonocardiaceae bacterium]
MCRIFGFFDARVTPHEFRTVSLLQRHGGPDAQTSVRGDGWIMGKNSWGIGNNRLAIIDLDGGNQPYVELDGELLVVFNGEIYNHSELRARLGALGYRFTDGCDGSVIPALYLEYGTSFCEHLDGMYAVAVMDLRAEPSLVLATDDSGMKSLYYSWEPRRGRLYFASEIPALLSFPDVGSQAWLPGLDAYLATKTPFGEETAFENIRVLPPAAMATLTRTAGFRVSRRDTSAPPHREIDFASAGAAVRQVLDEQVRRLLLADVPISTITSGGLDSSFVTALAAEAVPGLATFNIAYTGDWPADERGFAAEVAERSRTTHHQVLIDPATFPELLVKVVWHLGQPNADPITLSTYALFEQVRAAGFKVALTGDAADELFGGYARVKAAVAAPAGTDWVDGYVEALAAVPTSLRERLYSAQYRDYVASRGSAADQITAQLREPSESSKCRLETLSDFELGSRLPAYHLRRVDHLSMAHGVEARLPFCQPSLIRLARSLPAAHKVLGGQGKRVLYEAARPYLPTSVLDRPKQPFTLPITAMLREGQPLMTFAREVLAPTELRRAGLLDPLAVQNLLAEQASRPADQVALAVWSLLVYMLWIEEFGVARRQTGMAR